MSSSYSTLRDHIQAILAEGHQHSRQAGQWQKVDTYWHVGDALLSHIGNQPRADYGEQVVPRLGTDLGLAPDLLWDLLRFRRAMPSLVAYRSLTWSHVRKVLPLASQEQRRYYLQRANTEAWSVRQLDDALGADAYTLQATQPWAVSPEDDPYDGRPLRPGFGQLHTWRVLPDGDPAARDVWLDLGFHLSVPTDLPGIDQPRAGMIVSAEWDAQRNATFVRPSITRRFTYVATVRRVVDGDTIIVDVDTGLGPRLRNLRLRLRGIDCPELRTLAGRRAREFVDDALAIVSFIVIATYRTDSYGRYLADVRYLPDEADPEVVRTRGVYLNRQLLDEHLARRYPA